MGLFAARDLLVQQRFEKYNFELVDYMRTARVSAYKASKTLQFAFFPIHSMRKRNEK
jgi:hypothetical protein